MPSNEPRTRLREFSSLSPPAAGLSPPERRAGLVKDIRVLGLESANKRRYTPEALLRAVADGLYEGRPVYIDHDLTGGPRRFADKFGRVVNVRYADGNGLRGDLRYNPAHPMAEVFAGWLEHDPNGVGFSHSAYGKVRREDGVDVVYELEEVESVDLVAEPATTKGIHESMNPIIPDPTAPPPDVTSESSLMALPTRFRKRTISG